MAVAAAQSAKTERPSSPKKFELVAKPARKTEAADVAAAPAKSYDEVAAAVASDEFKAEYRRGILYDDMRTAEELLLEEIAEISPGSLSKKSKSLSNGHCGGPRHFGDRGILHFPRLWR